MSTRQRHALVTGSSGGIGRALVERFEEEGYRVIGLDQHPAQDSGVGPRLHIDLARFTRDASYRGQTEEALRREIGDNLDVLVNNAAEQILGSTQSVLPEDWLRTMDVNLTAPFLLVQAVLPALVSARGSVINMASIHGQLTKPGFVAYATSKAALIGLTRAMAVDLGDRVRVNAIAPAAIATRMLAAGFADNPEGFAQLEAFHPTGRIGHPQEVADLALMLASGRLPFLNGSVVSMDGGIGVRLHDPS